MENKKDKKRTIIFMSPTPPPYMGPSVVTELILNSKFVDEFNVIHIDTADRRPLNNLGRIDFINIYLAFRHYFLLLQKLIFSEAELVYIPISQKTVGFLRDLPFIFLSKLFKKKIILHLHGAHFQDFYNSTNFLMKKIIKKSLSQIDKMIILGNSLKNHFKTLLSEKKLSVVYNGIDISFEVDKDSEYFYPKNNYSKNNYTILFLSNFRESKGYKYVLFSVKKVIQYNFNVKYIFAGSWINYEDQRKCLHYVYKENLKDHVEFIGLVTGKKKIKILQEADIFVLPTFYDGLPLVIIEAMAAGLPIITTDTGCIKECVIDGENGFIIPKKNPDAIAKKIIYLIEHPEERERMGRRSRELYEQKFTKNHFVQRMIEVFKAVLEE